MATVEPISAVVTSYMGLVGKTDCQVGRDGREGRVRLIQRLSRKALLSALV